MTAQVVLRNGVGSVGKGTVAKALQASTAELFLHVEMDAFLAMLPEAYQDHPDGVAFLPVVGAEKPTVAVRAGPVAERALKGMRRAVAALAAAGNNLVVDEVLFGDVDSDYGNAVADYRALLAPFRFWMVGVSRRWGDRGARRVAARPPDRSGTMAVRPRSSRHGP